VSGELDSVSQNVLHAMKVELADNPDSSAGWFAPYAQKIFYFHVPSAWTSYLAFGVVFLSSILFLARGNRKWDLLALSSAEIGVVFCTIALISGSMWAKAEWGIFWNWDDTKLFVTFILWLVYLAYIALRSGAIELENVARLAAVFGILGFVAVPLSFISSRIWRSLHPNVIGVPETSISYEVALTLIVGLAAFTVLYVYLTRKRVQLERTKESIEELKDKIGGVA